MSAPKTHEGRRVALAKRRDTTRTRSVAELKAEIKRVGRMVQWSSEGRTDLHQVGWLLRCMVALVSPTPLAVAQVNRLDMLREAILDDCNGRAQPFPARQVTAVEVNEGGLRTLMAAIEARNVRTLVDQELASLELHEKEAAGGEADPEVEDLCRRALRPRDERRREP